MSYLFIVLSFLFVAQTGDPEPKQLSISATGKVELPADQVQFNINVNAVADNPQDAYELHQKREKALVQLLDQYDIQDEDISYEPIAISKQRNYNRNSDKEEPTYKTQQAVNVILRDFEVYEKIQIGLIKHAFDDFNGSFSTTDLEKGQDQALRKAIQEAKAKAKILAEEAGVNLGAVTNISYNHNTPQPYARETLQMKAQSDSGSMLKYNQSVTLSATVSMQFEING